MNTWTLKMQALVRWDFVNSISGVHLTSHLVGMIGNSMFQKAVAPIYCIIYQDFPVLPNLD